jgi:hypothetical protein
MFTSALTFGQLKENDNLLGGTLGFWAHENSPTFGVNYENEISQAGIGTFGLGAIMRFSSYTQNEQYKYSNVFFGGQVNYNFNQIGNGKFVPFLGLVLGFYSSAPEDKNLKESGLWVWGQGGMRYFFSPSVAGVARIGLGNFNFNTLELGIDFKF